MTIYELNPLRDPRWAPFIDRHPRSSVFHTRGWLKALHRTYGYQPIAVTTSPHGAELTNGIVFCDVRSWLTGRRLVSLPFSDHCDPLIEDTTQLGGMCAYLERERHRHGWRYIELRPQSMPPAAASDFADWEQSYCHIVDLRPDLDTLFHSFHKSSIQRKIRRAEREMLQYEEGRSDKLLREFYALLLLTRRRHHLPPQPFAWFENLAASLGPAMKIRIASHGEWPIAGLVTLCHRDTMLYKYGASNAAFHCLGSMQFLFWRTIQDARAQGCVALDLGRCDLNHSGLQTFKDRWGATRSLVTYWRSPASHLTSARLHRYIDSCVGRALGGAPDGLRVAAGRLLYRHVG